MNAAAALVNQTVFLYCSSEGQSLLDLFRLDEWWQARFLVDHQS